MVWIIKRLSTEIGDICKIGYFILYTTAFISYLLVFLTDPGVFLLQNPSKTINRFFEIDDIEIMNNSTNNKLKNSMRPDYQM